MLKRILFFSCEPGGAEVLIPVIKLVQAQPQWEAVVLGYGHALERFARKKVDCIEVRPIAKEDFSPFERFAPDMLITSATSLPDRDMSEKHLWRQAKQRGVPSLAFLDQWQNYSIRFSGVEEQERLAYLPDWINCLNETGRREMLPEGFENDKLVEFGHPYLSSLRDDLKKVDVAGVRARLHIAPEERVAIFISEAIREHYGNTRGYDQYQVLDFFLSCLSGSPGPLKILVKLHPKDSRTPFQWLAEKFKSLAPEFIGDELSSLECLAVSDFVAGMSSIVLVEAYVLGKAVVSLQPGLCVADPMVLSRNKLIPVVLHGERCDLFGLAHSGHEPFDVEFRQENFLSFVLQKLGEGEMAVPRATEHP